MRGLASRFWLPVLAFGLSSFTLQSCRRAPQTEPAPSPLPTALAEPTVVPGIRPVEVGIQWPAAGLQQLGPSDSLVLQFSDPVSPPPDVTALTLFPDVDGSLAWSAAGDALTFTPRDGFLAGQTYSAYLYPGLRGPRGEGLANQRLDFLVLSPPRVLSHSPGASQLKDRRPVIQLRFDRPMNPDSVAKALNISPQVELELSWDAARKTLSMVPHRPLPVGERYQFTLGSAAADEGGIALGQEYHWAYWLEALEIMVTPPQLGDLGEPISLKFNYPIDRASMDQALRVAPALPLTLSMSSAQQALLRPEQPLSPSTEYVIRFAAPLRDLDGNAYPEIGELRFVSPPPIVRYLPDAMQVPVDVRTVEITFDRPMDQGSIEDAFSITPEVPGRFVWQGNALTYHLEELLDYGQVYTVTLGSRARDIQGEPAFQEPFSWSFSHDYYGYFGSFGEFGALVQVVDAEGRRSLEFASPDRGVHQLTFELHKLSTQQFAALGRLDPSFRDPRLADVPGEAEMVYRWEVTSGVARSETGLEQLLIPREVPNGLYLLRMRNEGRVVDEIAIALSRYALALKRAGRQLLVWASEINGEVVPDMEIRIFAEDGRLVREGLTDEHGLYETTLAPGDEPVLAVGRTPQGGNTVAGFASTWRAYSASANRWSFAPPARSKEHIAYIYTDRPIYRPGQTVFFKAIVREDHDAQYRLLSSGTELPMRVLDARGNVLETQVLALNEFGTIHGQFPISAGGALGEYTLEAELSGETYRGSFQVQDYRKPDIQLEVTAGSAGVVVGDRIPIEVQATYFFGEPVPDSQIEVRLYELGEFYGNWWEPVTDDQELQYVWYPSYLEPIRGRTDAAGEFSAGWTARLGEQTGDWRRWWTGLRTTTWGVEVTVDDGSHQAVSDFAVVKVFGSSEQLQLDMGGFFKQPGQSFEVQAVVQDLQGNPVAGRDLLLEVRTWDRSAYGYDHVLSDYSLTTGADGAASASLPGLTSGYYQVRLTNFEARGEATQIERWIYVYRPGTSWARAQDDRPPLTIGADRNEYAPYDTANLFVESSIGGPALLTVERGTIRRERVIELTPPITTVELPILANDPPNIFVTVAVWQPQSTSLGGDYLWSNLPASWLQSASLELPVEAVGRELNVDIQASKPAYGPGEQAELRLQVTDASGGPVVAEVSLALVDEAIYALSEDLTEPMMEAFYGQRPNAVRTYSSMAPYREIYAPGRGGGGGGPGSPGNPRSDFEDLAAWFPDLRTDAKGELAVTLRMPHNLTSWRIVARAVTRDTRVGEGSLNVLTRQDLVVRPILPRQLTAGDTLTLSTLVHNFSDRRLEAKLALETVGLEIEGGAKQSVQLKAGESSVVGWTIAAPLAGEATLTVTAQAGLLSDAVQLKLPVQPLAVPDVLTQVGSFTGEWSTALVLPVDAAPLSTLTLELDRSIAGSVLSGLEYLTGFPYGCVEQIMSSALPNAVVGRAAARLGLSGPGLAADLDQKVNLGLQMLYAKQHADGGWGWWYDDRSHDYQTAWVIFGLALTEQAGYAVDRGSLERGSAWLVEHLADMDPRTQAYALYSMALAGFPEPEANLALAERALALDPFSQASLALALNEAGQRAEALTILEDLKTSLRQVGDQAYWPSPHEDGHYNEKTMASSTRSTALALDALVRLDPEYAGIEPVVRWLVAHRRPYGWGTTNETSFSVLALTDYLVAQAAAQGDTSYQVTLNGEEYARGALAGDSGNVEIVIPVEALRTGRNELRVVQQGEGKMYYALTSRIIRPRSAVGADGVVGVARRYLDAESGASIQRAAPGQLVRVEMSVVMPVDGFYLLIEDKLPGGLEALNENLNSDSHLVDDYGQSIYYWEELGYNYKEVRADRVSFFVTELSAGTHQYSYLARATHCGEFVALPSEVSAMYNPSLWGRSGSDVFEVVEPGEGGLAALGAGAD